jgi:hypothetical protein
MHKIQENSELQLIIGFTEYGLHIRHKESFHSDESGGLHRADGAKIIYRAVKCHLL